MGGHAFCHKFGEKAYLNDFTINLCDFASPSLTLYLNDLFSCMNIFMLFVMRLLHSLSTYHISLFFFFLAFMHENITYCYIFSFFIIMVCITLWLIFEPTIYKSYKDFCIFNVWLCTSLVPWVFSITFEIHLVGIYFSSSSSGRKISSMSSSMCPWYSWIGTFFFIFLTCFILTLLVNIFNFEAAVWRSWKNLSPLDFKVYGKNFTIDSWKVMKIYKNYFL